MVLVIDTNVLIVMRYSHPLLARYIMESHRFMLGIDSQGIILKEYRRSEFRNYVLDKIVKMLDQKKFSLAIPIDLTQLDGACEEKLCRILDFESDINRSAEIQLLLTALAGAPAILVHPDSELSTLPIPRKYLATKTIVMLNREYPNLRFKTCECVVDHINELPEGSPRDLQSLRTLLKSFMIAKQSTELDCLEFKLSEGGLNKRMCRDVAESACGMLNTTNGRIFLGIRDDGEIVGIPLYYNGKQKNLDEIQRIIEHHFDDIVPRPGLLVRMWPIDCENGKIVIAIWVEKGRAQYSYRNRVSYFRSGPQNKKNIVAIDKR